MKGDPKVIEVLNSVLADELTAVSQYMVHSRVCENWGYGKLHKTIEKRAIDEMKHAEKLIGRIIFLEGIPLSTISEKCLLVMKCLKCLPPTILLKLMLLKRIMLG